MASSRGARHVGRFEVLEERSLLVVGALDLPFATDPSVVVNNGDNLAGVIDLEDGCTGALIDRGTNVIGSRHILTAAHCVISAEEQLLQLTGNGNVDLTFNDGTASATATIPTNSTAAQIQNLVRALPNVGNNNVNVYDLGGGFFRFFFVNALNGQDFGAMTVGNFTNTANAAVVELRNGFDVTGTSLEVEFFMRNDDVTPGDGDLKPIAINGTVEVNPGWTGDFNDGSDIAVITLENIAPFGASDYQIFTGSNEVNQNMIITGYGLTGMPPGGTVPEPLVGEEYQRLTINASAGSFDLMLNGNTQTLPFNASSAQIETAIEAFPGITDVGVRQVTTGPHNGSFEIRIFTPAQNIDQMMVDTSSLTGTAVVNTTQNGGGDRELRMATNTFDGTSLGGTGLDIFLSNVAGEGVAGPGDSGGPAFIDTGGGDLAIAGVVSFGQNPTAVGALTTYTRVSSFANYVNSIIDPAISGMYELVVDMRDQVDGDDGKADTVTVQRNGADIEVKIGNDVVYRDAAGFINGVRFIGSGDDDLVSFEDIPNVNSIWVIDGNDEVSLNGTTAVANFVDLGIGSDKLVFGGGQVLGDVWGESGTDILDFSSQSSVGVNLTAPGFEDGFDGTVTSFIGGSFFDVDEIIGSNAGSTDQVTGLATNSSWNIAQAASSYTDLSQSIVLKSVEIFQGGSATDTFHLGTIFTGITVNGGGGDDELRGPNANTNWLLTGDRSGGINAQNFNFSSIETVTGGSMDDRFELGNAGDNFMIKGGGGTDTVVGPDFNRNWNVLGAGSGTILNGTTNQFEQIEDLVGGSAMDSFTIAAGGSLDGYIDGGDGANNVDFSTKNATVDVMLTQIGAHGFDGTASFLGNGFLNIDAIAGDAANGDSLTGLNIDAHWKFDDVSGSHYQVNGDTLLFAGFELLNGGNGNDEFLVVPPTKYAIQIDGNDPTTKPGDKLELDFNGVNNPQWNYVASGEGDFTFDNRMKITYQEIETLDVFDFGDLPDSYNTLDGSIGAKHRLGTPLRFGTLLDPEGDGQPTVDAIGDDNTGVPNDEDGILLPTTLVAHFRAAAIVNASHAAKLDAWVDFNGNGTFEPNEQIASSLHVNAGDNRVEFYVPYEDSIDGDTYARFRISSAGGLTPDGLAEDGEVQDYKISLTKANEGTVTLLSDPWAPGTADQLLVLAGTGWHDRITVFPNLDGDLLARMNGQTLGTFDPLTVDRIGSYGLDGKDLIKLDPLMNIQGELYGDKHADRILGGAAADFISGDHGPDVIFGQAGADFIRGGSGGDRLLGGPGDDMILGQNGADRIFGFDGSDVIYGHQGADVIFGQFGGDMIDGGADDDRIFGGRDDDVLFGRGGSDRIFTSAGNDFASGGDGNDFLFGQAGDDQLFGDNGQDMIFGGIGNDILSGGNGNDRLFGALGNDLLLGGSGEDQLFGQAGNDLLVASTSVYDSNQAALKLILNEWTNSSYLVGIQNIRNASGSVLTGTGVQLDLGSTVFEDGVKDELRGGLGEDWFFSVTPIDQLLNPQATEVIN